MKNSKELKELIDTYKKYFDPQNIPFFLHLEAMAYKYFGGTENLLRALKLSYQAIKESDLQNHPGVLHNFAETVVEVLELDIPLEEITDAIEENLSKTDLIKKAKKALEVALRKDGTYGKFHVTMGRLYSLEGKYKEAIKEIQEGIALEDPSEKDYALRISEYHMYLLNAKVGLNLQKQEDEIRKKIEKEKEELTRVVAEERLRSIEILSVFTALIGILLATVEFSVSINSSIEIGRVLLIMSGSLLMFISSASLLISSHSKYSNTSIARYLIVFILAIGLIFIGFWTGGK